MDDGGMSGSWGVITAAFAICRWFCFCLLGSRLLAFVAVEGLAFGVLVVIFGLLARIVQGMTTLPSWIMKVAPVIGWKVVSSAPPRFSKLLILMDAKDPVAAVTRKSLPEAVKMYSPS